MNKLVLALAQSLLMAAFLAAAPQQKEKKEDEEALKKDLTTVIALHGQPCGEVVAVKVRAENDYDASCKDGNKYHVYLNAEGRVVVEKQQ
jgi:hypothetical protein